MNPSILRLNPASGVPLYVQLIDQIKHSIESCALMPGDQLPGIRTLAEQLVVSPNTVVKAYTELQREAVIEVRHGAGAFVAVREEGRERGKAIPAVKSAVRELIGKLRRRGFSDNEIRRFVEAELNLENQEVWR